MEWYSLNDKTPPFGEFILIQTKFEKYQKYYIAWYNDRTGNFQLKDYDDMPIKANAVLAWTKISEYKGANYE